MSKFKIADFKHVPTACRFIALMPQWDFLDFLVQQEHRFPALTVLMQTQVRALTEHDGRVVGIEASTPQGPLAVRAQLVVGCDGRTFRWFVRPPALRCGDLGSPIDVLWFRL